MERDQLVLKALLTVNAISQDNHLAFGQKLQQILLEIINCMQAKSGSIMLMKGRKNLVVMASTKPELIGIKQALNAESPSAWVVQNKAPLKVDDIEKSTLFKKNSDRYKGAAFLLVPIIGNDKVIGVLNVTDKIGSAFFSVEEQQALLNISSLVIGALENQRLTELLKKKGLALQQKNAELKMLEKRKTELYDILIHDLKGPISEIVANLDILTYTIYDENLDYLRASLSGCDTLYRMVCNLLDISRLEENKLDLIYERVNPPDILKESVARVYGLAKTKDLTIEQKIPKNHADDFLWADLDILIRILQNLLSNAIQYSPAGESIECGLHHPDSRNIEFFIKDNGPGIAPQYHKAIFDKFLQLEKKTNGRIHTTGLGLTFCKMAVEAHYGEIKVISDGIHGSTFSFVIPREPKQKALSRNKR